MQGAPCLGESKEQAARSIVVILVILDDVCMLRGLSDFQIADVTLHSPLKGVVTEFELPGRQLLPDGLNRFHPEVLVCNITGMLVASQFSAGGAGEEGLTEVVQAARDQLLRDDVDLSGIAPLLQQVFAVVPRQPKGTHVGDAQARHYFAAGGKMLALELPVHHRGFCPRDEIGKRQVMLQVGCELVSVHLAGNDLAHDSTF